MLLNNKRQVVNAQQTNDGLNFVDTSSLVPMIAINRMEVIKDGASALYGSDAVAGVVNFITKKDYDGAKVTFDYQDGAHGKGLAKVESSRLAEISFDGDWNGKVAAVRTDDETRRPKLAHADRKGENRCHNQGSPSDRKIYLSPYSSRRRSKDSG